jgi:DNA-binding MarR family transcriptional regulator
MTRATAVDPIAPDRRNDEKARSGADDAALDRVLPPLTDEYTGWLITSLARRLSRNASQHYTRGWGVGSTEYRLVMAIGRAGPCSAVRAAAGADVDKAAASRSLKVLLEAGLIETVRIGRRMETQLTSEGRDLHAALTEQTARRDERLTRGMQPDEIERLRADLRRLLDNLPHMNGD